MPPNCPPGEETCTGHTGSGANLTVSYRPREHLAVDLRVHLAWPDSLAVVEGRVARVETNQFVVQVHPEAAESRRSLTLCCVSFVDGGWVHAFLSFDRGGMPPGLIALTLPQEAISQPCHTTWLEVSGAHGLVSHLILGRGLTVPISPTRLGATGLRAPLPVELANHEADGLIVGVSLELGPLSTEQGVDKALLPEGRQEIDVYFCPPDPPELDQVLLEVIRRLAASPA